MEDPMRGVRVDMFVRIFLGFQFSLEVIINSNEAVIQFIHSEVILKDLSW